jgi:hypothetical protein
MKVEKFYCKNKSVLTIMQWRVVKVKYRLIKNSYLTVMGLGHGQPFNRHYEKPAVFAKVADDFDGYAILAAPDGCRVYVSRPRLAECFEEIWEKTAIFGNADFGVEGE